MPVGPKRAGALQWRWRRSNTMDASHLTYMANQIARNLAAQGEDAAIAATAQHIRDFWDPRMKAALFSHDRSGLDPIAREAIERLITMQ